MSYPRFKGQCSSSSSYGRRCAVSAIGRIKQATGTPTLSYDKPRHTRPAQCLQRCRSPNCRNNCVDVQFARDVIFQDGRRVAARADDLSAEVNVRPTFIELARQYELGDQVDVFIEIAVSFDQKHPVPSQRERPRELGACKSGSHNKDVYGATGTVP